MADSVATVRLFRLERLGFQSVIEEKYPRALAYYHRMKRRHSFEEINKSYGRDADVH